MLTGLKLLLVEDDEDDYIITRDLLEEVHPGQITLQWVTSSKDAMHALRENHHDLCLVDFQLGPDNGLDLLYSAQAESIQTPFIMLTGHHDANLDIEAQRAGAVDYLVKAELNSASLARSVRYARARYQAEEERYQRLRAESESRAKSQFLAHLSHELRTPLTSILGYTELLLQKETLPKKLQDLNTIDRNGRHLLNLLNDVLDLSKIEAGKLDLDVTEVNLQSCLADLQSLLQVRADSKNIALHFSATEDLPETIATDATRLQQILLNLVGNAIKFTPSGRVDIVVSTTRGNDGTDHMLFKVIDTGIGISDAEKQNIFEPFVRSTNLAEHMSEAGAGLGLAISLELAKNLGGSIQCESTTGKGSTFTLDIAAGDLSCVPRSPLDLAVQVTAPGTATPITLSGRVLIVDDLEEIRELLGTVIAEAGADVLFAADGAHAIEEIQSRESTDNPIDAVLMDLQMPILGGFEALRRLRSRGCNLPVIALTASAMRGERERCLDAGFSDYMGKPVDMGKLLHILDDQLSDRSGAEDNRVGKQTEQRTVLLVEDNADARRATTTLIQHLGWTVIAAESAADTFTQLQIAASERQQESTDSPRLVDIALIDLGLPDIDGYQLTEQLRADWLPGSQIIALSGNQADVERLQRAGFDSHILKPIGLQQLQELLAQQ